MGVLLELHRCKGSATSEPLTPRPMIGASGRTFAFLLVAGRTIGCEAGVAHAPVVGAWLLCAGLAAASTPSGLPRAFNGHDYPRLHMQTFDISNSSTNARTKNLVETSSIDGRNVRGRGVAKWLNCGLTKLLFA